MKKLLVSKKAKITAFILLAVFAVTGILSAIGSAFVYDEFFVENKSGDNDNDFYKSGIFYNSARNMYYDVINICLTENNALRKIEEKYSEQKTNAAIRMSVYGDNFRIITNFPNDGRTIQYQRTEELYTPYFADYNYSENENLEFSVIFNLYFPDELTVNDTFYRGRALYSALYNFRFAIFALCGISAIALILLVVFIVASAGLRAGVEGVVFNRYDRLPLEIPLILTLLPLLFLGNNSVVTAVALAAVCVMLLIFLQTVSARIKHGKWYKNTVIYKIYTLLKKLLKKFFASLPVIWKAVLIFAGYMLVNVMLIVLFIVSHGFFIFPVFGVFFNLAAFAVFCILAYDVQKIKKASKSISEGNFDKKTDTGALLFDFRDIGENLNNISDANFRAIEAARKSERMKAELITNVSHDIKTPLTSIINYVDLLKKDGLDGEHAKEYLEVIDRQSARLKKMTGDLIDASKAATGNLDVDFSIMDTSEFVNQAVGEYTESFAENSLEVILSLPKAPVYIRADRKLMWRIIDNLLNNARKYSMPNTRIYIAVERKNSKAVISVKNISKEVLNVSADELTERFVRGDSSRNTEGSGLGLSIAKSLAELQNGELNIDIECDLFRAEIVFDETEKAAYVQPQ